MPIRYAHLPRYPRIAFAATEIAMELAPLQPTWLSGRDPGQEPTRAGSLADQAFTPAMWFVANRVLTVRTPLGRRVRDHFLHPPRGIPLGRVRRKHFATAGIERVPRTKGVRNGLPLLEDGTVLGVANIVWCTGFAPDYAWIDLPLPSRDGLPLHDRGIVPEHPGLYFVGLPFLYSLASMLLSGVGRDAEHVAAHLASRRAAKPRGPA